MQTQPKFEAGDSFTPDSLVAGGNVKTGSGTVNSGQNVTRGTLLGKITSGGNLTTSLSASSDGSENVYCILAEDVDASGGDVADVSIYLAGDFMSSEIVFGTGHTAATTLDAARALGLFWK